MTDLFAPLTFARGHAMPNRFALAPLTNTQSGVDGVLSEDEFHWLTLRAKGGFGLVMTCAAHVQRIGQGFPGQLGAWDDSHLPGLTRLASAIKAEGALAWIQLHHAGMRSPAELIGTEPVCPSANAEFHARAMSGDEVEALIEDFITAAERADKAGFDGIELHGAHGYVIAQFLSPEVNLRDDRWGGTPDNRARMLRDILAGIRKRCRPDLQLGVRLSPERFGLRLPEILDLAGSLMTDGALDMLDMSLWDWRKEPQDPAFQGKTLLSLFAELPRGKTRVGGAGKIGSAADVRTVLEQGLDFALLGRAAILHHDLPRLVQADPDFRPTALPVSPAYLAQEGLAPVFVDYMRAWKGFVSG